MCHSVVHRTLRVKMFALKTSASFLFLRVLVVRKWSCWQAAGQDELGRVVKFLLAAMQLYDGDNSSRIQGRNVCSGVSVCHTAIR